MDPSEPKTSRFWVWFLRKGAVGSTVRWLNQRYKEFEGDAPDSSEADLCSVVLERRCQEALRILPNSPKTALLLAMSQGEFDQTDDRTSGDLETDVTNLMNRLSYSTPITFRDLCRSVICIECDIKPGDGTAFWNTIEAIEQEMRSLGWE